MPTSNQGRTILGESANAEVEQSHVRIIIISLLSLYVVSGWLFAADGTERAAGAIVGVVALIWSLIHHLWVRLRPGVSRIRRAAAILGDNAGTTAFLVMAGEFGSMAFPIYLWVAFGNGFRYGRQYLYASQACAIIGFLMTWKFTAIWSSHPVFAGGILLGLVILPFYVAVLTTRLRQAVAREAELMEEKTRFVANVSHEMRTPLNGILGICGILVGRKLAAEDREIVMTLESAAKGMARMVDEVLDLSRLDAGKLEIVHEPFDLHRAVGSVCTLMRNQAKSKGLQFNLQIAADVPYLVLGDEDRLRQILLNLIGNAIKFTEKGEVRVNVTVMRSEGRKASVRFDVVDSGVGIAEEHQGKIFERFTQADNSTSRRFGGTGLGVTIAKSLVEAMGGEIGLMSKLGNGSTFWFKIDMERSDVARERLRGFGVLLLVPDGNAELDGMARQLSAKGIQVRKGHSVDSARSEIGAMVDGEMRHCVLVVHSDIDGDPLSVPRRIRDDIPEDLGFDAVCYRGASEMDAVQALLNGYTYIVGRGLHEEMLMESVLACAASVPVSKADENLDAPGGGVSVLLVDDNETNRIVTGMQLEKAGYSVTTAKDGEEALDKVSIRDFSVLLIDMHMPGMSGLDVIKHYRFMSLRENRAKIIVLSADTTPELVEEAKQCGADDYLVKPIDREKMLRTIKTLLVKTPAEPSKALEAAGGITVSTPVLDETVLANLVQLAESKTFLPKLIGGFLSDANVTLQRLQVAAAKGDSHAFGEQIHALQGSAGNIGAVQLLDVCRRAKALRGNEFKKEAALIVDELRGKLFDASMALEAFQEGLVR